MRVLHVIAGNSSGGAAKGALILHQSIRSALPDLTSSVLIQSGESVQEDGVISLEDFAWKTILGKTWRFFDKMELKYAGKQKGFPFSTGKRGVGISNLEIYQESDIIHLHWVNLSMLSVEQISKIDKPIVWTIRDMWPFTGGCHYSMNCTNYKQGCGECHLLSGNSKEDFSAKAYRIKLKALRSKKIYFVGISDWLSSCMRESKLYNPKLHTVQTIYNTVDEETFFPIPKLEARRMLSLPVDKNIILTGAIHNALPYKGVEKVIAAFDELSEEPDHLFVFFGHLDERIQERFTGQCVNMGYVQSDETMKLLYSAADVFVAGSIQEGFGKTIVESMLCGTPVVCFDATGPRELVEHKVTGYLSTPYLSESLSDGVNYLVDLDANEKQKMSLDCRKYTEERYKRIVSAKKYAELYSCILNEKLPADDIE